MSPFEFYCTLDVNNSGRISKIELKTGMQALGISISTNDFNILWKMIKKPLKKNIKKNNIDNDSPRARKVTIRSGPNGKKEEVAMEDLSYYELLLGLSNAGCFKFQ